MGSVPRGGVGPIAAMFMPRQRQTWTIPITPQVHALVSLPHPMSEAEWQQFLDVLNAMKPGLVREVSGG